MPAFERRRRLGDARRLDLLAWQRGEFRDVDLADVGREIDRTLVHLLTDRLVDQIYDELPAMADVRGGILQPAAGPRLQPEDHQRRVFAEDVEERERRGVHHAGGP